MIVYLVGFMGCGKSKMGKLLSIKLGYQFVDLDQFIEQKSGRAISDIFEDDGQPAFRNMETELLKICSTFHNTVISCGGGTPCFNENMQLMNDTGITVYLQMPAGGLFRRLTQSKKGNERRPLIAGKTDVELMNYILDTLAEREYHYTQAKHTIKAEGLKAETLHDVLKEDMERGLF